MDFDLPAEDDPRRLEVRAWLQANPKPGYALLFDQGYTVPHWPRPWGLGANPELQLIIDDELARAGIRAPHHKNPVPINNCGQSLLRHGTPEQQERFLKPALACEEVWCMLFSEPSAGSDVGALRTTARREGDHYVIRGQKMWTSLADKAQIGVLVARTDPSAPKHAGLSQFLVDMKSPGITIRPIADMSGESGEYNEVFFDDVIVPADRLLGKEGDGWKLSMQQLQTERVALSRPGAIWGSGPSARELVDGLVAAGRFKNPLVRDEAVGLWIEGEILRLLALRSLSDRMNARESGPEGAVRKMVAAPHGQRVLDLAKRSQGVAGLVKNRDVLPMTQAERGPFSNWDHAFWWSPAVTLGVGTQEVLKNVVAERVLGLPREKDPTRHTPFNQIGKAQPTQKEAA
ncbi:acyl-CoA dehydrogenase family protein [Hydrogenophaga sp. BPS33]|uniref:acyl-CoA dehydrogenase family protein n=1 Tax=Hydrogenophaga sp. BPS33 TaxID=2651974 RepID=UPI00132035B1|nr:acyl-CoA dehydrogenase family protein [Hydrogenophaga sp. BPS33]QHE84181.1 acyl-CoA dehydrogenase [Hydrogenophaga sp. BPS33]